MTCLTHACWRSASDNPHGHMGTEGGEVVVKSLDLETGRQQERAIPLVTRRAALGLLASGAAALLAACSSPPPTSAAAPNPPRPATTGQGAPPPQAAAS